MVLRFSFSNVTLPRTLGNAVQPHTSMRSEETPTMPASEGEGAGIADRALLILERERIGRRGAGNADQSSLQPAANPIDHMPLRIVNLGPLSLQTRLTSSDFVGDSGEVIGRDLVSFEPEGLYMSPLSEQTIKLRIALPPRTPPGQYSGLVQALGLSDVRSVVSFVVTSFNAP